MSTQRIGFKAKPQTEDTKERTIQHQEYYTLSNGVECIDVAGQFNFNVGNAIKYLWRNGRKFEMGYSTGEKAIEDLKKAKIYIDYEIKRLESDGKS